MDGKLCPGIQTPSMKFSPSSFRESPPFNPEIFQTLPPFSNFGLYLNPPPPPLLERRGVPIMRPCSSQSFLQF